MEAIILDTQQADEVRQQREEAEATAKKSAKKRGGRGGQQKSARGGQSAMSNAVPERFTLIDDTMVQPGESVGPVGWNAVAQYMNDTQEQVEQRPTRRTVEEEYDVER